MFNETKLPFLMKETYELVTSIENLLNNINVAIKKNEPLLLRKSILSLLYIHDDKKIKSFDHPLFFAIKNNNFNMVQCLLNGDLIKPNNLFIEYAKNINPAIAKLLKKDQRFHTQILKGKICRNFEYYNTFNSLCIDKNSLLNSPCIDKNSLLFYYSQNKNSSIISINSTYNRLNGRTPKLLKNKSN